jgi:hypothetical protein
MIQVPEKFRPRIRVDYPPNNRMIFEEWFYKDYIYNVSRETEREYLPIMWTGYYVNNNYGQDRHALRELQTFIDNLDKSKKYFTIVQYDDGILNDVSKIDLRVFGMGGGHYDYPLPLTAQPHPYSFTVERDIFCNFMGALTHPIRKELLPIAKKAGYLCSTANMPIESYCMNLARSVFTLAPRGYGLTSFRLKEAVEFGSIPVYISDRFMIPHNEPFDYGVGIIPERIKDIDKILKSFTPEEIAYKQKRLKEVWEMFTYEGCKSRILKHLS